MRTRIITWAALAACAAILAIAWIMTDELGAGVVVPLLAALTAGGLLIAREKTAFGASILAGVVGAVHAGVLLANGRHGLALVMAYLISALALLACGAVLRRTAPREDLPAGQA